MTEKEPDAGAKRQETQKGECVPNLRVLTKPNIKPPLLTTGAFPLKLLLKVDSVINWVNLYPLDNAIESTG